MENVNETIKYFRTLIGKEFSNGPSAFGNWLFPTIIEINEGEIVANYKVRKDMLNPAKMLHGGVTAAIMDDIIGATLYCMELGYFYSTINNSIDYFSPAKEGDLLTAKTSIIKKGSKIIHAHCDIWNLPAKTHIAKGHGNLIKTEIKIG
jgi:acyl-coenzyme A thioesterase 13